MPPLAVNEVHCRSLHGTCVAINGKGVFIAGKPGSGKSLLALSLLKHGHQLISDDLTTFHNVGNKLIAFCPPTIKNWLYVRNIGFINVAESFGEKALAETVMIELVIHLYKTSSTGLQSDKVVTLGSNLRVTTLSLCNPVDDWLVEE